MSSLLTALSYTITRAAPSDAGEILELQHLAYQSEARLYDDFSIPPLRQTLVNLEQEFESKTVLKATANKQLLGSVRFYEKETTCYLERLIVHPNFQHQGIGTTLMNHVETLSKSKRFELFTGHKSESNIRFYEKLGYSFFRSEVASEKLTFVYMEKFN